jgi:hypothetical protein
VVRRRAGALTGRAAAEAALEALLPQLTAPEPAEDRPSFMWPGTARGSAAPPLRTTAHRRCAPLGASSVYVGQS